MNLSVSVRRLAAVVLPAALLATGAPLLGGVAAASHSIIGVNPAGSVNNVTATVFISGSGFQPGAQVRLRRDNLGEADVIDGTVDPTQSDADTLRATFDLDLANPGTYDVVVQQLTDINNTDRECNACFTITPIANPTVNSVVAGVQLGQLTVNGTNFAKSSAVKFFSGGAEDTALVFTRTGNPTATTITGTYTAGPSAVPGLHDVRVVNTDGSFGSCTNCFFQPKIDNLSHNSIGQGASNVNIQVHGAGLTGGAVSFSPSTGITINGQNVVSDNQINVNVSVASNAAPGGRTLNVRHGNGGFHSFAIAITGAPDISGISPSSRGQGASGTLTLTGSNFVPGMSVVFSPNTGITVGTVTVNNTGNATVAYSLSQTAPTGARNVIVTNPDLGTTTESNGFTVNAGPKVTKVVPAALNRNTVGNEVQIQGTGFDSNVTIDWGAGITQIGGALVNPSGTAITAVVNVAADAPGGLRSVTVQNAGDGGRGTCQAPGCLGVNTLTVVGTAAATNNGVKTITVNKPGGGFEAGSVVTMVRNGTVAGQGPITGTVTDVTNGTANLTFTVDLNHVAPGSYSINVDTNGTLDACVTCYTVNGGTPTLADVNPDEVGKGAQGHTVSFTGTNFANGTTISFSRGVSFVPENGITVVPGSVDVISLTSMTAQINVAPGTTSGAVNVTITTPGEPTGQSATCLNCLTVVDAPSFTAAGVSPNARGQGAQTVTVTIVGQNFDTGGVSVSFGEGVNTGTPVVADGGPVSDDTIQVPVSVDGSAPVGGRDVTVVNEDGGRTTCPSCFSVTAAPTVTSVSPSVGKAGEQVNVTITGTNFNISGTVQPQVSAGPDIIVSNVVRTGPTQITARFAISPSPTFGPRDVEVTNPDGGRGTGFNAFSVVTVPGAPSIGTATAGDQSATVTWSVPGSNGGSAITGYRIACEPACQEVVVAGAATQGTVTDLTNGTTYRLKVRAINAAGEGPYSALSNSVLPIGPDGDFVALPPKRVLDTRLINGGTGGQPIGGGKTLELRVTGGSTTVPTSGVSAIVANVTAVKPTATSGHLRLFPTGDPRPNASTLNFTRGVTVPNLVKLRVGAGGKVSIFNSSGSTHVLFDVVGYFLDGTTGSGQKLTSISPDRAFDTRGGNNTGNSPIGATGVRHIHIPSGAPGVPNDASAVVINVTVTQPQKNGYLTVWPGGTSRPVVSNLNYVGGQTVANLVVVKLGTGGSQGQLSLYNGSLGTVEVLGDVVGYYKATGGGKQFKPLSPVRILDTRSSTPVSGLGTKDVQLLGAGGVPNNVAVTAVVVNVTVVSPPTSGFLTVYPKGESRPLASNINFSKGQTVANLAVLKVGTDGKATIYAGAPGHTHVLFDVVGYYV